MEFVIFRGNREYLNLDYSLHLPSRNIQEIQEIEGLSDLKTIRALYLDNNHIKKIENLDNLAKLTTLSIRYNKIENLEGIGKLIQLEELTISGNPIKSLEGIENLVNLRYLFAENCEIEKISKLRKLRNLEKLWLNINRIEVIGGLDNLPNLNNLGLQGNIISEISGLGNLGNLEILDLRENQITNISGLGNLKQLKKIKIENNPIPYDLWHKFDTERWYPNKAQIYVKYSRGEYVEFEEKFYFTDNKQLHLSGLGITQLSQVKNLNNLIEIELLNLSSNNIEVIDSIQNLINLKILWLSHNQIKDIRNVDYLTQIEEISLGNNYITNLRGLESLKNLKDLDLGSNNIQDISGLEHLCNLSSLNLSNNTEIKDFSLLPNLRSLKKLKLRNTRLHTLDIIKDLKNLQELDLSENDIECIPRLNLPQLQLLDLSKNNIKSMDSLCQFPNLEYLDLNDNFIDDITCLSPMLKTLNKLYIANNNVNRELYEKLHISDIKGDPNANNSRYFIMYNILKDKFNSYSESDILEIDFNNLIDNSPLLKQIKYSKLRDLLHCFREDLEIRCGPNQRPISIISPKAFAVQLEELLNQMMPGKEFPLADLVHQNRMCSKKAVKRLLKSIKNRKLTKSAFYYNDSNIIKAADIFSERMQKEDIFHFFDIASEDDFTQLFFAPLVKSMGYENVKVKGHKTKTLEYGQDIKLMRLRLPTGHFLYFVAQIKRGDIKSSSQEPDKEIEKILTEIRPAFNKRIFDDEIGKQVKPHHVYLVTSGYINEYARAYLEEQLEDEYKGQLLLLDRDKLFDLYIEYGVSTPEQSALENFP